MRSARRVAGRCCASQIHARPRHWDRASAEDRIILFGSGSFPLSLVSTSWAANLSLASHWRYLHHCWLALLGCYAVQQGYSLGQSPSQFTPSRRMSACAQPCPIQGQIVFPMMAVFRPHARHPYSSQRGISPSNGRATRSTRRYVTLLLSGLTYRDALRDSSLRRPTE